MSVRNNQAVQHLVDCIGRAVDRAGLTAHFRQPCNILNHELRVTSRRVVVQLPLIFALTDEQVASLKNVLEIELPFNCAIVDLKVWQPTGGYLGFVNIRMSQGRIWPASVGPVELSVEVKQ